MSYYCNKSLLPHSGKGCKFILKIYSPKILSISPTWTCYCRWSSVLTETLFSSSVANNIRYPRQPANSSGTSTRVPVAMNVPELMNDIINSIPDYVPDDFTVIINHVSNATDLLLLVYQPTWRCKPATVTTPTVYLEKLGLRKRTLYTICKHHIVSTSTVHCDMHGMYYTSFFPCIWCARHVLSHHLLPCIHQSLCAARSVISSSTTQILKFMLYRVFSGDHALHLRLKSSFLRASADMHGTYCNGQPTVRLLLRSVHYSSSFCTVSTTTSTLRRRLLWEKLGGRHPSAAGVYLI